MLKIELVYSSFEKPTVALKVIEEAASKFEGKVCIKEIGSWKDQKRTEELGFYGLLPVSSLLVLVNGNEDHPLAKKISLLAHEGNTGDLVKELAAAIRTRN